MIDITQDIQPLTTFRNHSAKMLQHLKKTGRPIVLTVNGKAEATILSAIEYQRLMDIAAQADEREAIRQAREDIAAGHVYPARQVSKQPKTRMSTPPPPHIGLTSGNHCR
jgi:prevent-host-death family protein